MSGVVINVSVVGRWQHSRSEATWSRSPDAGEDFSWGLSLEGVAVTSAHSHINFDHTVSTSVAGSGHWTSSGQGIAVTLDIGDVWAGKITAKGLNTAKNPGTRFLWAFNTSGTWYATWS